MRSRARWRGRSKAKLLPGEHAAAQSEQPPGGNLEAYNALLQGRFYSPRGTEADVRKAIAFFTQAIELDPNYALAWSELSRAWIALSADFLEGCRRRRLMRRRVRRRPIALALSPDLAAAHLAQGDLLQFADLNWRGAKAEYRRALDCAQ
jgi:tetratricopeptide (TPR) repeat protein